MNESAKDTQAMLLEELRAAQECDPRAPFFAEDLFQRAADKIERLRAIEERAKMSLVEYDDNDVVLAQHLLAFILRGDKVDA